MQCENSTNHQHCPKLTNPNNSTIQKYQKKKKKKQINMPTHNNFSSKTYNIQEFPQEKIATK